MSKIAIAILHQPIYYLSMARTFFQSQIAGPVWYTNYESRKGRELAEVPFAALQFHWVELERVVRIEGRVERTSEEESDTYFASRPLDSRIGAWASPQSQVIPSRATLVAAAARYGAQFMLAPPRPPHWGGYRLQPDRWEFWQGRKSRPRRTGSAAGRAAGSCAPARTPSGRAAAGNRPNAAAAAATA